MVVSGAFEGKTSVHVNDGVPGFSELTNAFFERNFAICGIGVVSANSPEMKLS